MSLEYLRQWRVGQFTVFDTVASYVGILILSPILSWLMSRLDLKVPLISWLWLTMPLSVIFHLIFNQSTPLMKVLTNPRTFDFYIAVIILLVMTYLGLRKVRRISTS